MATSLASWICRVLLQQIHVHLPAPNIDTCTVTCDPVCTLQADPPPGSPTGAHGRGPRLYVGGVPDEITEEDIVEHFNKWGQVVDCYFPGAILYNPLLRLITRISCSTIRTQKRGGMAVSYCAISSLLRRFSRTHVHACCKVRWACTSCIHFGDEAVAPECAPCVKEVIDALSCAGKKGAKRVNYCFITFENWRSAQRACNQSERNIHGKVGTYIEQNCMACCKVVAVADRQIGVLSTCINFAAGYDLRTHN